MFFLAYRHLTSRKRQTVLAITGIAMGVAAYISIAGLMRGFQNFIIDQLVNNDAHIRISSREEYIEPHSLDHIFFPNAAHIFWLSLPSGRRDSAKITYPSNWFNRLNNDPNVQAYSQQLVAQVIVRRGKITSTARLIGSDPARQIKVTNIAKYMLKGKFKDIGLSGNKIIIGSGLLNKLGAQVKESILLSSGQSSPIPFKIVGVFELGVKNLNDMLIFASLPDVQKVNQTPSQISDIAVKLFDVTLANTLAQTWAEYSQDKVQSWDQANEGAMSVFKTQDIVRNTMTFSILIVAGFGIYNILTMAVSQKRKDIAILRSIGFEPKDISRLFIIQGSILGGIGGIIGTVLGYAICLTLAQISISPQRMIGTGKMMISFEISIYVYGFAMGLVSAIVASFLPAKAAGKMEPIDIIRSEGT